MVKTAPNSRRQTPAQAARPEDVCQGALGNCWFAGALSVVAQLPELIDRICVTKVAGT